MSTVFQSVSNQADRGHSGSVSCPYSQHVGSALRHDDTLWQLKKDNKP